MINLANIEYSKNMYGKEKFNNNERNEDNYYSKFRNIPYNIWRDSVIKGLFEGNKIGSIITKEIEEHLHNLYMSNTPILDAIELYDNNLNKTKFSL